MSDIVTKVNAFLGWWTFSARAWVRQAQLCLVIVLKCLYNSIAICSLLKLCVIFFYSLLVVSLISFAFSSFWIHYYPGISFFVLLLWNKTFSLRTAISEAWFAFSAASYSTYAHSFITAHATSLYLPAIDEYNLRNKTKHFITSCALCFFFFFFLLR